MKILVDADAFIGLLSPEDLLHQKVLSLTSKLMRVDADIQYFCTWEVVVEAATKLRYRLGKKHAQLFLEYIEKIKSTIIYPTHASTDQALAHFFEIKTKDISLTDAANIAVMKDLNLDAIFSFDKIYVKNGLTLLKDAL